MSRMSEMNRRDFGLALAALGTFQTGAGTLGASKVFAPEMVKGANGSQRWGLPGGALATGESVAMHESIVPAGTPKGTLHTILHSEFILLMEGTVMFEHDGTVDEVKAGSVMYVAYGTNHLVWNSGDSQARYFVFQMGGDTKKA